MEDIENAVVSMSQERLKHIKLTSFSSSYRRASDLSWTFYKTGATDFLDTPDAECSLYSAKESVIKSRASIATDYIDFNRTLDGGGGGEADLSTPAATDHGKLIS